MVEEKDLSMMVDLYELTMAQAYWSEGMEEPATFSLFFRKMPRHRNFVLACGQQQVAHIIESLRFSQEHIDRLRELDMFEPDFLDWLRRFRFSGSIHALPEGTPVFPQEPLLEVEAPIAEAQLLESLIMNYVHLESVLASKAARLVQAAGDRPVVDFGMRRMHGLDAAYRGVRAFRIAGLSGTSNVLAGLDFDLPIRGTMAHSFVQACDDEMAAFRTYARLYPGTTLLVDTYDTEKAVQDIIRWMKDSPDVDIGAIRLDSGDLAELAFSCRKMLDEAGYKDIKIMASSGLDEYKIARLREQGAPLDGFGVGTAVGASNDAPALELAYKLTEYAGKPRMKNSPGKQSFPGRKQVYRQQDTDGNYTRDIITHRDESAEGTPLLVPTLWAGRAVEGAIASLDDATAASREAVSRLPERLRQLDEAEDYQVTISERLQKLQSRTLESLGVKHS
ncbi:nicotinate phosphoribosyltransferase [Marinobacter nanhaiticus D15-8W]|uniref:Nicotinate phosphoribosyltransferase n=1 Tax=Marinobacter nanhaiticus D15-8W TaxID=626887 RepID=N6VYZ6_9GAMM|nr:nicotinate phosphoribosyltransferase [Marinobacter nanhaiticus]ENO13094.1 nicotinate phosphoribosyltransferase [Marinobacter nanhaiticus D15-8W]BES70450.1 nicotinate phosphoribosyltransferase [Marinobacter nanhaiticus D15-8W]